MSEQDWTMFWGRAFAKIAVWEIVFSWTFILTVVALSVVYLVWMSYRTAHEKEKKQSILKFFFRFKWREIIIYLGMTLALLVVIGTISLSVTFHAAAFNEGMKKGCLVAEELGDSYVFTLPAECLKQELLWNRVELKKNDSHEAFNYLKKLPTR